MPFSHRELPVWNHRSDHFVPPADNTREKSTMRITAVSRNHRRGLRACTALASAATLTAALAAGSPPAQAALSSHRPGATTPDTISSFSTLSGVSADSSADAWAVGDYTN